MRPSFSMVELRGPNGVILTDTWKNMQFKFGLSEDMFKAFLTGTNRIELTPKYHLELMH